MHVVHMNPAARCVVLLVAMVSLPPTALCEDDDGEVSITSLLYQLTPVPTQVRFTRQVIPAQLPVNDRQIDDIVEELIDASNGGADLRPLGLHGMMLGQH